MKTPRDISYDGEYEVLPDSFFHFILISMVGRLGVGNYLWANLVLSGQG